MRRGLSIVLDFSMEGPLPTLGKPLGHFGQEGGKGSSILKIKRNEKRGGEGG